MSDRRGEEGGRGRGCEIVKGVGRRKGCVGRRWCRCVWVGGRCGRTGISQRDTRVGGGMSGGNEVAAES